MSEVRSKTAEVRDSVRVEQVMVAVHDTLTVTKTTTVVLREPQEPNEKPDTIRMTTETERDRVRLMADVRSKKEEVRVVRDTVYIEKRDSVLESRNYGTTGGQSGKTALHTTLRLVLWIIIALAGLIIVIKLFNILK